MGPLPTILAMFVKSFNRRTGQVRPVIDAESVLLNPIEIPTC